MPVSLIGASAEGTIPVVLLLIPNELAFFDCAFLFDNLPILNGKVTY